MTARTEVKPTVAIKVTIARLGELWLYGSWKGFKFREMVQLRNNIIPNPTDTATIMDRASSSGGLTPAAGFTPRETYSVIEATSIITEALFSFRDSTRLSKHRAKIRSAHDNRRRQSRYKPDRSLDQPL